MPASSAAMTAWTSSAIDGVLLHVSQCAAGHITPSQPSPIEGEGSKNGTLSACGLPGRGPGAAADKGPKAVIHRARPARQVGEVAVNERQLAVGVGRARSGF